MKLGTVSPASTAYEIDQVLRPRYTSSNTVNLSTHRRSPEKQVCCAGSPVIVERMDLVKYDESFDLTYIFCEEEDYCS